MDANAIADTWFRRMLESYPERTARFLLMEPDQFRNPVGHAFREALNILTAQLFGNMETAKTRAALDRVVRIRAIQDFTPDQVVSFVYELKDVLPPDLLTQDVRWRIDQLALTASELHVCCREQIAQIRAKEKASLRASAGG